MQGKNSIIAEINFSKNANELYNLMVKKYFRKETEKKNSEEIINGEITLFQKRIANLQDDFEENKSRTPKINEVVRLLLAADDGFSEKGTTQIFKKFELSLWWS